MKKRSAVAWMALVAMLAGSGLLAGCSGSSGSDGAPGAAGPPGPPGPPAPGASRTMTQPKKRI